MTISTKAPKYASGRLPFRYHLMTCVSLHEASNQSRYVLLPRWESILDSLTQKCRGTVCIRLPHLSIPIVVPNWQDAARNIPQIMPPRGLFMSLWSMSLLKILHPHWARYQSVPSMPPSCPAVERSKMGDSVWFVCCEYRSVPRRSQTCMSKCLRVFGSCGKWSPSFSQQWQDCLHLGTTFLAKPMAIAAALAALAWLELCDVPQIGSDRCQSEGLWWPSVTIQITLCVQAIEKLLCEDMFRSFTNELALKSFKWYSEV